MAVERPRPPLVGEKDLMGVIPEKRRRRFSVAPEFLSRINLDDPATYAEVSAGELMRFLRGSRKLTEVARGAKIHWKVYGFLERGDGRYAYSQERFAGVLKGLEMEPGSKTARVLEEKFVQVEAERRERKLKKGKKSMGAFVDYDKLFERVDVDTPSTFDGLTLGETLEYLRRSSGGIKPGIKGCSEELFGKYVTGERKILSGQGLKSFLEGLGLNRDDPRAKILYSKYTGE